MTGWQRFFLMIVCSLLVMILWPQYDSAGLTFMFMSALLWTCVIILLSVLSGIFGIYKFEFLNRFISILYLGALLACLLFYFPLKNGDTPAKRMQKNQWPTKADVKEGMRRLTFNFDFVRRNVNRDANFVNQKIDSATDTATEIRKELKEKKEQLDIFVEKLEGEK